MRRREKRRVRKRVRRGRLMKTKTSSYMDYAGQAIATATVTQETRKLAREENRARNRTTQMSRRRRR